VLKGQGYDTSAILGDAYFAPRRWNGITRGFNRVVDSALTVSPRPVHNGPQVTDAAIAELARTRDRPLFMWVHYYDAHSPHVQPRESPVFGKQRADVYDAELWFVDRELGRLLPAIERSLGGKALVVISADHGIAFDAPRHDKFNYGYDLYSSVLHVPLIFHAPFIAARSLPGAVSTMDVMPTLLNLLRMRPTLPLEGVSLVPELLRGERSRPPQLMHQMFLEERLWKSEEPLERVSLRTDRFNLLHDRKSGFYELYDYQRDYFERRDLANDPAFEETLQELRGQLALLVHVSRRPDAAPADKPAAAAAPPAGKRAAVAAPPAKPAAVAAPTGAR
jgi:arylsulfatase A-like enzyme